MAASGTLQTVGEWLQGVQLSAASTLPPSLFLPAPMHGLENTHASGLLGWLPSMSEMVNVADQVCPCPSLLILVTGSGGGVVVLAR